MLVKEEIKQLDETPELDRLTLLPTEILYHILSQIPLTKEKISVVLKLSLTSQLYRTGRPHLLHFMFDEETNEIWPYYNEADGLKCTEDGKFLIKKIRELTGDKNYEYAEYHGR